MPRRRTFFLALLTILLSTPAAANDLADSFAGADLIVEGRVIESHPANLNLPGSPVVTTVYTIAISRVLVGVAEDSTLEFTVLGSDRPPPGAPEARGWHVVAAGNRIALDGWKVWGSVVYVFDSGSLWPYEDSSNHRHLESASGRMAFTLESLLRRLEELRPRFSTGAFEGAAGVALVTLREYQNYGSPFRGAYSCDSLRWVYPAVDRVPRRISFLRLPSCSPDFGPNSTVLVPVSAGTGADSLFTDACPHGWVVESGFVRGLGVPLAEIDRALEVRDGRIHVRPFLVNLPRGK